MAAVDPPESPERRECPAEGVQTSEDKTEVVESRSGVIQKNETTCDKSAASPDDERRASAGNDGGPRVASHPGVSGESGADRTTCISPEVQTSAGKMAEVSGSDQRAFDWSEAEEDDDDGEAKTQKEGNDTCDLNNVSESADGVQHGAHAGDNSAADVRKVHKEETPHKSTEKQPVGGGDRVEDVVEVGGDAGRGEEDDLAAKPKKCRLVCKECGKRFTRRETFNLHRHFHAHEDELTPLTCKECGLTFQHRSALIKHRNEHKEEKEEQQLVTPKKEMQTKEWGSFECAECQRIFFNVDKLRDHNCSNTVEKPYHCPLCRQDFQFKVSITKHMNAHSQERRFACQECSQTFPNIMALRCHQRCHAALKSYECPECGMVFKHYLVMEDHRRKHTDNTRSHLCNICGKIFKYSSLLHQHQYLHTGQKPFRCQECGKHFALAQNMKAHCRQHRLQETCEQPAKKPPAPVQEAAKVLGKENSQSQSQEPKRKFKCPLCSQTYSAPANLRAHMFVHEAEYETLDRLPRPPKEEQKQGENGHTCPHCPYVCLDESSLNTHLSSVHMPVAHNLETVATPPIKQLNQSSSENLQEKWRSDVIGMKSYRCPECGKTFRHRSVLELHVRIHSKDKPYQCKVCNKGFRFSSYLQQHLIIHTGQKPYKCPDCGKDFAFLQNMKTHQKLHQEKPFRCTSCRKGYSDLTQLQQHILSHNGDKPHKCNMCDKSFGLAYLLRDHMNTHTGERPHRCEECHKTFSWFSSLLVHQKIHARKRPGFSQYSSLPTGARVRGRGSRGRRGGRLTWGWSRPLGGLGMDNSQPTPFPVSALREYELLTRAVQPQSTVPSSHVDSESRQQKEPRASKPRTQPVQWKVDGGEVMPVPTSQQQHTAPKQSDHQRSSGSADSSVITQSCATSAQSSESSHGKESVAAVVSSQPKPITWSSTPTSTVLASTSALPHEFSLPSYIDGAALWSIRPSQLANSQSSPNKLGQELQMPRWPGGPVSTQKEPSKKEDNRVKPLTVSQPEKPRASGSAGSSTAAKKDQSSAMPISTPVSLGVGSTLWDIQTPAGIPKMINSPEKLVSNQDFVLQQKQVSSGWANVQSPTGTQKVPISIQYEPHRFGQALGTSVWGFQSSSGGPPTLLTGQLKPGTGQELQQQPMVTGTQIIINPASPFFTSALAQLPALSLPGPHPLHSVAVGTLPRPPHPNIFFTPQAVPQLAPRTEPLKLGPGLPFAPERLLQCMICGCSLPRELDLQMHYLQHAQGEI